MCHVGYRGIGRCMARRRTPLTDALFACIALRTSASFCTAPGTATELHLKLTHSVKKWWWFGFNPALSGRKSRLQAPRSARQTAMALPRPLDHPNQTSAFSFWNSPRPYKPGFLLRRACLIKPFASDSTWRFKVSSRTSAERSCGTNRPWGLHSV